MKTRQEQPRGRQARGHEPGSTWRSLPWRVSSPLTGAPSCGTATRKWSR